VLWEALALGFRRPTAETLERLTAVEGAEALADAAAVLDEDGGPALAPLARRLGRTVDVGALMVAYDRLFGHTARGVVPPYETEYGADSLFQPMQEMSDLGAFYRAFGLRLALEAHERADHVSCECEFLAFLARKEAYALERDDPAMARGTERAARRFLGDHLGRWAPGLGRALARHDPDGLLGALGTLCAALVMRECARMGVATGPDLLRLRSTADPDAPAACGLPAEPAER
jgi:TorA maturation chaperone TorD